MRVAILGAGAIAFGMAAFLAKAGHRPVIWSPSGSRTHKLANGSALSAKGAVEFSGTIDIATECAEAVMGADAVVVALPANGHRLAFDAAHPHLVSGQPVIVSSHSSFGALYLARRLAERNIQLPITVWGTTLLTGRQDKDYTGVSVNTVRQKIDLATLPRSMSDAGKDLCTELFGDRFVSRDGLLAIALSNLNPQNHLAIALLNLTRMEKAEVWGQGEHVTPAVGRLIEALDLERLRIAEKFNVSVRTVQEHFSLSFHVPMGSVSEMNQQMHHEGRGGFGPATTDSRYIYEDVPFGLVATSLLGRIVGLPAVLHEAGTSLFSAAVGRDLVGDNDLLPELSLADLSPSELLVLCEEWPQGGGTS